MTAQLDLGIKTDSAHSALDTLLSKIRTTRTELQQLLAAIPDPLAEQLKQQAAEINTLKQQMSSLGSVTKSMTAEQALAFEKLQHDLEQANKKIVKEAEDTARKVSYSFRAALGNDVGMTLKLNGAEALKAAAGDLTVITGTSKQINQALTEAGNRQQAFRREVQATQVTMLRGETERQQAARAAGIEQQGAELLRRREGEETGRTMLRALLDRQRASRAASIEQQGADLERKKQAEETGRVMIRAEAERQSAARAAGIEQQGAELARYRQAQTTGRVMLMAEVERMKASRAAAIEQQGADLARRKESEETGRVMLMAEINRQREGQATGRSMLMAELDRRKEARQTYNEMQRAELARQEDIKRTGRDMTMAEVTRRAQNRIALLDSTYENLPPKSQLRLAERARSYGGKDNITPNMVEEQFGTLAASANITELRRQVAALGNSTRQTTGAAQDLHNEHRRGQPILRNTAELNRGVRDAMNDAHSAARGLAGGLNQLWLTYGSVVPLAAGAALTGALAGVFKVGKDVEYQLQFVRALANDFERQPIDLNSFLNIAGGTVASVKEAAEGMRQLSQAGLSQRQALSALPDILNLATVGEMSVGQAAIAATGVVTAFGLSLMDTAKVGDIFAKIAASSNTSVLGMTESMKQASTVGEQFHVSIEEASATMGVLAQRNIMGSAAGTSLTNAMKSLYEPSKQAEKAMELIGLKTSTTAGGLKNFSTLVEELRGKLMSMDEASRAVFLGTITDQRGAKAISALTENWDKYKDMLFEAQTAAGFMSKAVLELEDTVEKSSQRIANHLQVAFVKAFQEAAPEIRQVQEALNAAVRSQAFVNALTDLTVGVTRLSKVLMENGSTLLWLLGIYAGFKILTNTVTLIEGVTMALRLKKVAALEAAIANGTLSASEATLARATIAGSAARVGAGAGLRLVAGALGPIAGLLMVAYTAWEIYNAHLEKSRERHLALEPEKNKVALATLEQEKNLVKLNNTTDLTIDYYDRQIKKLDELNKQLEENARKSKEAISATTIARMNAERIEAFTAMEAAKSEMQRAQADVAQSTSGSRSQVRTANGSLVTVPDKNMPTRVDPQVAVRSAQATAALEAATKRYNEAADRMQKLSQNDLMLMDRSDKNQILTGTENSQKAVQRIIDSIKAANQQIQSKQQVKDILSQAYALQNRLDKDDSEWLRAPAAVKALQEQLNPLLNKFRKPDPSADNDAYRAALLGFDSEINDLKRAEKSALTALKSGVKTGLVGDFEAIGQELQVTTDKHEAIIKEIEGKIALADRTKNKKADSQRFSNDRDREIDVIAEANNKADQKRAEIVKRVDDEIYAVDRQSLLDRGQLVEAFMADYERRYRVLRDKLLRDLLSENTSDADKALAGRLLGSLDKLQLDGTQKAGFEEKKNEFLRQYNEMQTQIEAVNAKSEAHGGISSAIGVEQAVQEIRNNALPSLQLLQAEMQKAAGSNPKLQAEASKFGRDLAVQANRQMDLWRTVGKVIEKSLTDAFGKGGAAVGGLIRSVIEYKAAQQAVNNALAERTKGKNPDSPEVIKETDEARKQSAQLQLQTFGNMADAAKGFFDENSRGYAALQAAEKVFRAGQLAMAVYNAVAETGLIQTVFGVKQATTVAAAATDTAATGKSVINSGVRASADASSALAKTLASVPYPYNLIAAGTVLAALVAAGVRVMGGVGGGGGAQVREERQKTQGSGSVLGDPMKQSESIGKSIDKLKDNSDLANEYSGKMLVQLQGIRDGIAGMGTFIARSAGISGTVLDERLINQDKNVFLSFSRYIKELVDAGISSDPGLQSLSSLRLGQYNAHGYQDIHEHSSSVFGLFSSDSDSRQYLDLSSDLKRQIALVLTGMGDAIGTAGEQLGVSHTEMQRRVGGEQVSLGDISLMGMSPEEQQKALEAVFSQVGDMMAHDILPGFDAFQKAGEGYLQTVVRVSSDIEGAKTKLAEFGITAVDAAQEAAKAGDLQANIVRDSILAKETHQIPGTQIETNMMGGGIIGGALNLLVLGQAQTELSAVGKIMQGVSGSASDLTSAYKQLLAAQSDLNVAGLGDITTDLIAGAGGLDNLKSSLSAYIDLLDPAAVAYARQNELAKKFNDLGYQLPKTKEEFVALVQSIDTSTESGRKLKGELIALSGAMKDVADPLKDAREKILEQQNKLVDALADSVQKLFSVLKTGRDLIKGIDQQLGTYSPQARIDELWASLTGAGQDLTLEQQMEMAGELKDLILEKYQSEKDGAQKLLDLAKQLKDYVASLKTGELSPLVNAAKLAEAKSQYETTLSKAQGGDTDAMGQLQGKADTYLQLSREFYASSGAYTAIFNSVVSALDALGAAGNGQSELEKQAAAQTAELQALRAKIVELNTAAKGQYDTQVQQLKNALEWQKKMEDQLGVANTQLALLSTMPADIAAQLAQAFPGLATWNPAQGLPGQQNHFRTITGAASPFTSAMEYSQIIQGESYDDRFRRIYMTLYGIDPDTNGAVETSAMNQNLSTDWQKQLGYSPAVYDYDALKDPTGTGTSVYSADFLQRYPELAGTNLSYDAVMAYIAAHPAVSGSHYTGLDYVPVDGYIAELHRGERVLTASESANLNGMQTLYERVMGLVSDPQTPHRSNVPMQQWLDMMREEPAPEQPGSQGQQTAETAREIRLLRDEVRRLGTLLAEQIATVTHAQYDSTNLAADKVVRGQRSAAEQQQWLDRSRPATR